MKDDLVAYRCGTLGCAVEAIIACDVVDGSFTDEDVVAFGECDHPTLVPIVMKEEDR